MSAFPIDLFLALDTIKPFGYAFDLGFLFCFSMVGCPSTNVFGGRRLVGGLAAARAVLLISVPILHIFRGKKLKGHRR